MSWQFGDFGAGEDLETYRVQSGDTLSKISQKFYGNFSMVQAIADENGITNINLVIEGQVLRLPNRFSTRPIKPGPPYQSPILAPLPQPTPPTYDLPYTRPITLPVTPPEIPYTQPITLPAPILTPIQTPATPKQPVNVSIFDFMKQIPSSASKSVLGIPLWQWGVTAALLGVTIGLIVMGGSPKTARNPRRKRR